nr:hypothetical protein [uncultured Lelliottia sp.]
MRYAIVDNGKVINTVIWDGEGDLFDGEDVIEAPEGVGIGWTYNGDDFIPIEYNQDEIAVRE